MAVAYESVAIAISATVGKPAGLAEGDLMIAHLSGSSESSVSIDNYSKPGWTLIAGDQSSAGFVTNRATALYKIADSSDVAASNFVFTEDADVESKCGAIFRFSGAAGAGGGEPDGAADDDPTPTGSHTFTNTLTPAFANSIMLILTSCANNGGTSWSSQAITTDNPASWTEVYDFADTGAGGGGDTTIAGVYASRPETTATGDSTASSVVVVSDSVGIVVAVYPRTDTTVNATPLIIGATLPNPTLTGDANYTASPLTTTITLPDQTITAQQNTVWTLEDEPSESTWTNEDLI